MIQIQQVAKMVSLEGPISLRQLRPSEVTDRREGQELVFSVGGELTVCIEGRSIRLKQGELLFLPPHVRYLPRFHDGVRAYVLSFSCPESFPHAIYPADLTQLLRETETRLPGWEQMARGLLERQLLQCLRTTGLEIQSRTVSTDASLQHIWLGHQVRAYLHDHFSDHITLELLAALHDVSLTHLKRVFKAQTGTTIIAYLTDLRMNQAKALIRQGTLTFTQIAEAVGYDNIYYFSTQFKKQTGMTPTEYSKQAP